MEKELISILTPSYNNGDIIHRLLDSILMQTYQKIEMFVIDDGSTDNTKEVILKYIDKFSKRGIVLNYIYQSNQGQSVAINKGLKLINGEYLVWPDADDFYASNTVLEEMVNAFRESNENVGMVRTYANLLDEKSLKVIGNVGPSYKQKTTLSLFEDCLFARPTFWFAPGEYMVRVDVLSECIPELDIYTSKLAGQNWQIMLPILYRYECKTIEKFSYNILVRKMSHSRGQFNTLHDELKKCEAYENTIINTLLKINIPTNIYEQYEYEIKIKYLKARLKKYVKYLNKKESQIIFEYLKNVNCSNSLTIKEKIFFSLYFSIIGKYLVLLYLKFHK